MSNYDEQTAQAIQIAKEIRSSGLSGRFVLEQWTHQQRKLVRAVSFLSQKEIDNLVQSVAILRDPQSISDEKSSVFACCKEMLEVKGMLVVDDEIRKKNVEVDRQLKLQICGFAMEKAEDRMQMLGFKFVRSPQPVTQKYRQYLARRRAQRKRSAELVDKPSFEPQSPSLFYRLSLRAIGIIEKTMDIIKSKLFFSKNKEPENKQTRQNKRQS